MAENRGRPKETPIEIKQKWVEEHHEVPSKPELGWSSKWYYDRSKTQFGPYKVENTPPKGWKAPKIKPEKGKAYNKQPVVMVFKTSNRSNAKTKMKVWKNENIDYILNAPKLPGVPDKAEILEVGVGASFIEKYQSKYNL
jgi:hypothetical protein